MTKIEAAKKLEEMTLSSTDKNIVGFLKFYLNGGVEKALEGGKTLDQLFTLAESKGVVFPAELKACMQAIFTQ